jgi:hypothetical protein
LLQDVIPKNLWQGWSKATPLEDAMEWMLVNKKSHLKSFAAALQMMGQKSSLDVIHMSPFNKQFE